MTEQKEEIKLNNSPVPVPLAVKRKELIQQNRQSKVRASKVRQR